MLKTRKEKKSEKIVKANTNWISVSKINQLKIDFKIVYVSRIN